MAAVVAVAASVLVLAQVNAAVVSTGALGSDVTILTHNDLYGNSSTRRAAALVLSSRQSRSQSQAGCDALQETLWAPSNTSNLDFLGYLGYNKDKDDAGLYWIGSQGTGCRAITPHGQVRSVACDTRLPALCSQSAALSSNSSADTGPRWQVAVKTGDATIVGFRDKLSFRFLGIRYAPQPKRFEYSKYEAPTGNITALQYGAGCFQRGCTAPKCSEDCLMLNVWTPYLPAKTPAREKKAVMFWVHGGGFVTGYGSDTDFDGGNMAARGDVIVVTMNYRLSTLGTLALENTASKGNYWLSDQIAALDWVRANIEAFGGDKSRITVFGQSAGGAAVRALLASPLSREKFSRAIMHSTPGGVGLGSMFSTYPSIVSTTNQTKAILNEVGCAHADALSCLRTVDPSTLIGLRNGSYTGTVSSTAVVDGTYLPTDRLQLDGSGPTLNIAIMTGHMRDDGAPFTSYSSTTNVTQTLIDQGFDAATILSSSAFPLPNGPNATLNLFNLTSRLSTDVSFRCSSQATAHAAALHAVFPKVFAYENVRGYQILWSPNPPSCEAPVDHAHPYGDTQAPHYMCHSGDLYTVFGTTLRQGRPPRDEQDVPFSQYIIDAWTAFGRTADPNPDLKFLEARGFTNTSRLVRSTPRWEEASADLGAETNMRILDAVPSNEGWREKRQCDVVGVPLDFWA